MSHTLRIFPPVYFPQLNYYTPRLNHRIYNLLLRKRTGGKWKLCGANGPVEKCRAITVAPEYGRNLHLIKAKKVLIHKGYKCAHSIPLQKQVLEQILGLCFTEHFPFSNVLEFFGFFFCQTCKFCLRISILNFLKI